MTATLAEETTPTTRAAVRGLPRRVPRPTSEPPYDDEPRAERQQPAETQGALALDLRRDALAADSWRLRRHLSVVEDTTADPEGDERFFGRQRTSRAALADPRPFCARYVQALVEVLAGERPVGQLMRWTADDIYAEMQQRVRALRRASGRVPARAGRGRALVRSVHVQEPKDGVAEACVHVKHAGKSRAVAIRLEGLDGHWRCTALQFG